ncbi:MAG: hypothetical protein WBW99_21630 [Pseudolabrys sp.]
MLVRKEIHPAIIDLLARAISEAHSGTGPFQKAGDFPTLTDPEYPVAQSARDFYTNGPSFLNRYLPFWMTGYVQRIIAVLVAVIAIVLPVFNYAPKLFLWFIRERVRKLYRRLRIVDKALLTDLTPPQQEMRLRGGKLSKSMRWKPPSIFGKKPIAPLRLHTRDACDNHR